MKTVFVLIFLMNGQPTGVAPNTFEAGDICNAQGYKWIQRHGADDPSMKIPTFHCAPVTIPAASEARPAEPVPTK